MSTALSRAAISTSSLTWGLNLNFTGGGTLSRADYGAFVSAPSSTTSNQAAVSTRSCGGVSQGRVRYICFARPVSRPASMSRVSWPSNVVRRAGRSRSRGRSAHRFSNWRLTSSRRRTLPPTRRLRTERRNASGRSCCRVRVTRSSPASGAFRPRTCSTALKRDRRRPRRGVATAVTAVVVLVMGLTDGLAGDHGMHRASLLPLAHQTAPDRPTPRRDRLRRLVDVRFRLQHHSAATWQDHLSP